MTPCQRDANGVFNYLDGELDTSAQRQVEKHIEECCDCSRLLRRIRLQKSYMKRLTRLQTQDSFVPVLQDRIRREAAGRRSRSGGIRWIPAFGLAVFALAATVWFLMLKPHRFDAGSNSGPVGQIASTPSTVAADTVHYVMDDIPSSGGDRAVSLSRAEAAKSDTVARIKNVDALKGRLTPVSF
jgi:anti-sigma factor RsiW